MATKDEYYKALLEEVDGLIGENRNWVSNTANVAALIFFGLRARGESDLNWAGFYVKDTMDGGLTLGPFQGPIACVDIPPGKGVCGAAAAGKATVLVPNVHEFPGHIACSSATNSEIVVPLLLGDGSVIGVLDLDAVNFNAFDAADQRGLEAVAKLIAERSDWPTTFRESYRTRRVHH